MGSGLSQTGIYGKWTVSEGFLLRTGQSVRSIQGNRAGYKGVFWEIELSLRGI